MSGKERIREGDGEGWEVIAISLWEPWAAAIKLKLKCIETRGWSTKYRGPIAIHAARSRGHLKQVPEEVWPVLRALLHPDAATRPLAAQVVPLVEEALQQLRLQQLRLQQQQ